jgi:hypothetical protein
VQRVLAQAEALQAASPPRPRKPSHRASRETGGAGPLSDGGPEVLTRVQAGRRRTRPWRRR